MPIAHWICAGCGGREVPLTHFAETECGEKVHPDYCTAILNDREGQYVKGAVRVSHGLGCPRRAAIEEAEQFSVDPLELNPPIKGTAWHAFVEAAAPRDYAELEVEGTISGVKVRGKIDRLRKLPSGDWAIEDWKCISDFQIKYRKLDGVKLEHRIQASIYAELLDQMGRERPTVGIIWYSSSVGGKDALMPAKFDLMPLSEALNSRPYDCEFTVLELYRQAASHYEDGVRWDELPLAGSSIIFGSKTACNYCTVQSICTEADKGAPF